ncbi:hypothetical protein ACJJTC_006221 [Scirpophaga incertulas]
MYKFFALLCVTVFIKNTYSATAILPPQDKPAEFADKEGCFIPELNSVIPPNTTMSPPPSTAGCKQYQCQTDGFTQIYGCGVVAGGADCPKIEGDSSAPYPGCCSTLACK